MKAKIKTKTRVLEKSKEPKENRSSLFRNSFRPAGIILCLLLIFSFSLLAVFPGLNFSVRAAGEIEQELGLELGPGAGEIADMIAEELDGETDIFVYEATEMEPEGELVVSTIMFLVEKEDIFEVHNLPLRTTIGPDEAEELARKVNKGKDADYLWLNLSYFIEIVDLYDGVTVETARGPKEMSTEEALDYLNHGLDVDGEYEFDRLQRQEQIMWGLEAEMEAHEGMPPLGDMISLIYGGLQEINTNIGLIRGVNLGFRLIRGGPEDIKMYQPDTPEYSY